MRLRYSRGLTLAALAAMLLSGCDHGSQNLSQGKKAEQIKDYDAALEYYNKALHDSPGNIGYQLDADRARFEDGQYHVDQGRKLREQGNLQLAIAEFRKATMVDPSSPVAAQELKSALAELAGPAAPASSATTAMPSPSSSSAAIPVGPADGDQVMAGPPALQPLSRAPINLKATNDSRAVFDAVTKLAGLTVIFDPDFTSRRINVDLTDVTLEQALNIVSLESKAFWRPVTGNIIFVIPDTPQKRKDYEEEVVKTFYLSNTVQPQEITEIITTIRQLLDLRRVSQINAQNAIVIRDTPDRVLLAGKIIDDIDKAKPEVVIQVSILQARTDKLRDIGIQPGTSAALAFTPPTTTTTSSTTSTTTPTSSLPLSQLQHLSSSDYSVTLPGAQANFLMTDSTTHIIDDPEIRVVDGQTAKLKIGDRVPVATGSFQAGVGVGTTGAAGVINPLVNTQFQYLDVGVNVTVTPRIHPDHEVSMKVTVEVSSVTGSSSIGGISQPIISQRSVDHDIRLKDGEVNVLGGLIERTDTVNVNGWPFLSKLPLFRYFFSDNSVDHAENEVLIVLTPHIVRLPEITADNLRSIASGTDTNAEISMENAVTSPAIAKAQAASMPPPGANQAPGQAPALAAAPANPATANAAPQLPPPGAAAGPQLRFDPGTVNLHPGETSTVGLVVQNVQDLFSIPLLLQFNPAVVSIEDVRQGGFLSGGTQEIAIVERVDKERGQAIISATRMPNTSGVSGSGTLVGVVVKGIAPGNSQLSVVQVNAKDSQQKPIPLVTGEATIKVQ